MVPLLKAIALLACVQLAGRITDVGLTPYALVKPILKRMNLKQLSVLEANCPTVTPESDEIWGYLIEKDFPDRPIHSGTQQQLLVGEHSDMPNRALYHRYQEERDLFRASSAQRLRKMTEKLQKEKSKNSITPIPSILRTTPIRRSYTDSLTRRSYNDPRVSLKTILGKAMRDIQQRKLMFGAQKKPQYDPYAAFQSKSVSPPPSQPRLRLLHQKGPESPKSAKRHINKRPDPAPSQLSTAPNEAISPRKRPAPPAIFVPKKRMPPRAPRIPPDPEARRKGQARTSVPKSIPLSKEKKLSIFH